MKLSPQLHSKLGKKLNLLDKEITRKGHMHITLFSLLKDLKILKQRAKKASLSL